MRDCSDSAAPSVELTECNGANFRSLWESLNHTSPPLILIKRTIFTHLGTKRYGKCSPSVLTNCRAFQLRPLTRKS